MNTLFDTFADEDIPFSCLQLYLESVKAHENWAEEEGVSIKKILKYLEENLSRHKTCDHKPLLVLESLVNQCCANVFVDHCMHWVERLQKIIQLNDNCNVVGLACKIMLDLFPFVVQNPELNRQFTNSVVANLVTMLLTPKEKVQLYRLQVLKECIRCFPGPCRQFRIQMEKFSTSFFTSQNKSILEEAVDCFILLPSLVGGNEVGANATDGWDEYFNKTLASIHDVLSVLYEHEEKSEAPIWIPTHKTTLDLPVLDKNTHPVIRLENHRQRFHILSSCIVKMMTAATSGTIHISTEDVIGLVSRILAVTLNSLSSQETSDSLMLMAVLPLLHEDAVSILLAAIKTCHWNLVVHANIICKLLKNALQSTQSNETEGNDSKPFSKLRIQIYRTICHWAQVTCGGGLELHAEQLIQHVISDMKNPVKKVQLQIHTNEKDKKGKKRKRGQVFGQIGVIGRSKDNPVNNSELCINALKALKSLHYAVGSNLPSNVYINLCNVVADLTFSIQQNGVFPSPYKNAKCRRKLYAVVRALTLVTPRNVGSPLNLALSLFTRGMQDTNNKVSAFCLESRITCTQLIHPRLPPRHLWQPICEKRNMITNDGPASPVSDVMSSATDEVRDLEMDIITEEVEKKTEHEITCVSMGVQVVPLASVATQYDIEITKEKPKTSKSEEVQTDFEIHLVDECSVEINVLEKEDVVKKTDKPESPKQPILHLPPVEIVDIDSPPSPSLPVKRLKVSSPLKPNPAKDGSLTVDEMLQDFVC